MCDIDSKLTNESDDDNSKTGIKFPKIMGEDIRLVKNLNILLNKQMQEFDRAYPDIDTEKNENSMVTDVRELFFSILRPILNELIKTVPESSQQTTQGARKDANEVKYVYIDTNRDADDVGTVFEKYFNKEAFLDVFDGPDLEFVKKLVDGGAF